MMTIEQIEMRKVITQLLADNGINRETIVPFVKEIISEKVEKSLKDQIENQKQVDNLLNRIIQTEIRDMVKNEVRNKVYRIFNDVNIHVEVDVNNGK